MTRQHSTPDLYKSTTYCCPYLSDQTAANLLVDPDFDVTPSIYDGLIHNGFRRNGNIYYRPHCPTCHECRSVRIPVSKFQPNRSQKRVGRKNSDVQFRLQSPSYSDEHFSLYLRYQSARHTGDNMDDPDPDKYRQFLVQADIDTFQIEMRAHGHLLGVSVVDHVANGLSSVYTFFDPNQKQRSLGTLAILHQVELARQIEYEWLYLGYWIKDCSKMNYKNNFNPLEEFEIRTRNWQEIT